MKTPQAQAAVADLQLWSRRTDRHSNTEGDMMSLMYSDVTANEGEAARALAVSITAVLAGVEETLSPPERTQAARKRKPSLRRKGTSLL